MKKPHLFGAILGLTALLTACGGNDTPTLTHTLTIKLEGVTIASVTVTNTTTKAQIFSGTLEGSKAFGDLKAGDVFKVEGGAVNGQTAPAVQTVTLDGDKTVTLTYKAAQSPTTSHSLTVKVEGASSVPMTVTNTTTNTQLFQGMLEGSKTFGGLTAGDVFKIEGGTANGFTAPAAQTVTLDADKMVTLTYTAAAPALPPEVVAGTLTPYKSGPAIISAYGLSYGASLAQAAVTADGQFRLQLPATLPASQLFAFPGEGCRVQPTVSPADTRFVYTNIYPVTQGSDTLGTVQEVVQEGAADGSGRRELMRFYASAAARVTGQLVCNGGNITVDLNLKAGWNAVEFAVDTVSNGQVVAGALRTYTGGAPTIQFSLIAQPLRVQLNTGYAEVKRGESFTVGVQVTVPDDAGSDVGVELVDPPVGFSLSTSSLPTGAVGNAVSQKSGVVRLLERGRTLGSQPSSISVHPESTRSANITIQTTLEAERTNTGYRGPQALRLRFKYGEQQTEATVYVNVTGPGVRTDFRDSYYNVSSITLGVGDTGTLTTLVTPEGGFTGEVRLSMSDAASGISGESSPVTLGTDSRSVPFTVTVPSSTAPGTYNLTVRATHAAGTERVGSLSVVVKAPSVKVAAQSVTLYGSETANLPVTVTSEYGFEGPMTVTAADLPVGVTAMPVTVTVPRGGAVSALLPLSGAENLGIVPSTQITLTASGTNVSASGTTTISLQPKRFLLGQVNVQSTTPARDGGFWFTSQAYEQYGASIKLARFDGTNVVDEVTLPGAYSYYYSWPLTTAPSGEVWVLGGGRAYLYGGGQVQSWSMDQGSTSPVAADNKQRLYFVGYDSASNQYRLKRLNAASGKVETLPGVSLPTNANYAPLVRNADGTALFLYDGSNARLLRVETASGIVTPLPLPGLSSITAVAVDASGTPWVYGRSSDYNMQVGRVNGDGTLSLYPFSFGDSVLTFGFDDQGLLWGAGNYNNVVKAFDPKTATTSRSLELGYGSAQNFVLNLSGGIWKTWADSTVRSSYTSLIR
ncbi:hypothetical protein [Deinococcus apachensis]|uniref:hypothetical protein n=1 Tax=Deinococcus apachensis TaxID=309886 RepID=UPI00037F594F|nr:hypothetical protein [Deinococcus apachensis]